VNTYVVTLQCTDGPGIVLAASSAIVALDGNIVENDQFTDPVTNQFCMRTRFESAVAEADVVRTTLGDRLAKFQPTLGVRLENVRRRALVLVSRADHCLADLLYRREQGEMPLDIPIAVPSLRATTFRFMRFP
jgi:formyltetrahydrofolate deformylase